MMCLYIYIVLCIKSLLLSLSLCVVLSTRLGISFLGHWFKMIIASPKNSIDPNRKLIPHPLWNIFETSWWQTFVSEILRVHILQHDAKLVQLLQVSTPSIRERSSLNKYIFTKLQLRSEMKTIPQKPIGPVGKTWVNQMIVARHHWSPIAARVAFDHTTQQPVGGSEKETHGLYVYDMWVQLTLVNHML